MKLSYSSYLIILLFLTVNGLFVSSIQSSIPENSTNNLITKINTQTVDNDMITNKLEYNTQPKLRMSFMDNVSARISIDMDENGVFSLNELVFRLVIGHESTVSFNTSSFEQTANNTYYIEYLINLEGSNGSSTTTIRKYHYLPFIYIEELVTVNDYLDEIKGIRFDNTYNLKRFGDYAKSSSLNSEVSIENSPNFEATEDPKWVAWRNSTTNIVSSLMTRNNPSHYAPFVQTGTGDDMAIGLNRINMDPTSPDAVDNASYYAESLFMIDYSGNYDNVTEIASNFHNNKSIVDRQLPSFSKVMQSPFVLGANQTDIWNEYLTVSSSKSHPEIHLYNRDPRDPLFHGWYNDPIAYKFERISAFTTDHLIQCNFNDPNCATYYTDTMHSDKFVELVYHIEFYDHNGFLSENQLAYVEIKFSLHADLHQVIIDMKVQKLRDDTMTIEMVSDMRNFNYFSTDTDILANIDHDLVYDPVNIDTHKKIGFISTDHNYQILAMSHKFDDIYGTGLWPIIDLPSNYVKMKFLAQPSIMYTGETRINRASVHLLPDLNAKLKVPSNLIQPSEQGIDATSLPFEHTILYESSVRTSQIVQGDFDGDLLPEVYTGYLNDSNFAEETHKITYFDYKDYWQLSSIQPAVADPIFEVAGTELSYQDLVVFPLDSNKEIRWHLNKFGNWVSSSQSLSLQDILLLSGKYVDLDDDPQLEVFYNNTIYDLDLWDFTTIKTVLPNYDYTAIADYDGDGKDELAGLQIGSRVIDIIDWNTLINSNQTINLDDYTWSGNADFDLTFAHLIGTNIGGSKFANLLLAYNEPEPTSKSYLYEFSYDEPTGDMLGGNQISSFNHGIFEIHSIDIDDDGFQEIFISSYHGNQSIILEFYDGSYRSQTYYFDTDAAFMEFGDFNGDGSTDMLASTWPNGQLIFFQLPRSNNETVSEEPSITITSPTDGSTLGSTTVTVTLDIIGEEYLDYVEYYFDDILVNTIYEYPYSWNFDPHSYPSGEYLLTAIAYDHDGNTYTHSIRFAIEMYEDQISVFFNNIQNGDEFQGLVEIELWILSATEIELIDFYVNMDLTHSRVSNPFSWDTTNHENGDCEITVIVENINGFTASDSAHVLIVNPEKLEPTLGITLSYTRMWIPTLIIISSIYYYFKKRKTLSYTDSIL